MSTIHMKRLKSGLLGLALVGAVATLSGCADGYSSTSYGMSLSTYDTGYTSRRDRDGDGIPNRYDFDRDGDGVTNRFDWSPNNPYRR